MTAKTTAETFFNNFVVHYGIPKRIHSDQGANFTGKLMQELCAMLQIDKSRTTPYHPMGNGMCERFNRTLCNMLGTLDPDSKKNWKGHVGPLVHAYNCTRHETTGYSPFSLMFGREPRIPIDLAFGLDMEPNKSKSVRAYNTELRERLKHAFDLASTTVKKSQERQKLYYDQKASAAVLKPGDRVLVKIVAFDVMSGDDDLVIISTYPSETSLSADIAADGPTEVEVVQDDQREDISAGDEVLEVDAEISEDAVSEISEDDVSNEPVSDELPTHLVDVDPDPRGNDIVVEDTPITPPTPSLRRSSRRRTQPTWMTGGDYVFSAVSQPDWFVRANYLRSLLAEGVLTIQSEVSHAILSLVTGDAK
ncbi:uncharacterized protein LOC121383818 [Gigantopelta aegis]|uniref:uncharacterized protein LOC121383818 n=1 Tax=Gigantopelta aegis TaxID=1735272 RepID=UPI001B88C1B5|nr:uncharacterized protein LOC121383818 [Gigantopelta aegis]